MNDIERVLSGLRAVAEPTRLRLLVLCAHGELTVSELTQILGQSQPRVSRHLKLLCDAGLLDRLPEGSWVFYRLQREGAGRARWPASILDLLPLDGRRLSPATASASRRSAARAPKSAARYFRENAAQWDEIRSLHVDDAEVERRLVELIPPSAVRDLLDIGTGTGRILELFGAQGDHAGSASTCRARCCRSRASISSAPGSSDCYVRQGDMYQLPWPGSVVRRGHYPSGAAFRRRAGRGDRRGGARAAARRPPGDRRFRAARARPSAARACPSPARLCR